MVNNGGFMKIKRVKNKIGFFIWAIIGFCLVMLLYKIGANADSVQIVSSCKDRFTIRVDSSSSTGFSIQSNSVESLSYAPVSAGTEYIELNSAKFLYFTTYNPISISWNSPLSIREVERVSFPFVPSVDGYLCMTGGAQGVCTPLPIYYNESTGSTKTLTDISVNKTKTTYFVGEEFTFNDISVDALYSDLSSENVTNFTVDYSSVNINVVGTYQISVTYEGITKTIPIVYESIPVTLTSISAVKSKTNYYVGDTLNTNDFVVTGIWSDGTETVLSDYTVSISAVHMNTVGSYPITVSYEDKTTTVYITVNAVEEPPVEPPLGDLTTTNALLQKLDIDINNNLYEVRLLCGFNVALLIASIFLRRKS